MRRSTILAVLPAATMLMMLLSGSAQGTPPTGRGKPGGTTTTTTTTTTLQELVSVTVEVKTQDQVEVYSNGIVGQTVPLPPVADERSCVVRVEPGASAVTVLDAAVAAGCMQSYELRYTDREWYGPTSYIVCVDGTCNQSAGERWESWQWLAGGGREWRHYVNGAGITYLEWFSADDGDVLTLSYQVTGGACVVVFTIGTFHCYDVVQVR